MMHDYNFPPEFVTRMRALLGDDAESFFNALGEDAPSSVRFNPAKVVTPCLSDHKLVPIPWCDGGFYVSPRPNFTLDPSFHSGAYYVQEASSMLLAQVQSFLPQRSLLALDFCAAPGGKSTLLNQILPSDSILVCNEINHHRANILSENMQKWGSDRIIVTESNPIEWRKMHDLFDLILVDAPCSGEGMFRKDPDAISHWSTANIALCVERQREILDMAWKMLKPGGLLVYSTCTYNTQENEEQIQYMKDHYDLQALSLENAYLNEHALSAFSPYPCYRMMPHKVCGEGLFMCFMHKDGATNTSIRAEKKKTKNKPSAFAKECDLVKDWLLSSCKDTYNLELFPNNLIYALPLQMLSLVAELNQSKIRIHYAGIVVAEVKGRSLIPTHSLALSTSLRQEAFVQYAVDKDKALKFLAKEAVTLPSTVPQGYILLLYEGVPIGFVKNLGNRCNSLMPNEWRIRNLDSMI